MRGLIRLFLLCCVLLMWCSPAAAQPAPSETPAEKAGVEKAGAEVPKAPPPPPASPDTVVEVDKNAAKPAKPAAPESGDEAYNLKITELEGRVNDLKEKIFRSKTRLAILKETVLSSSIAGAEAQIVHRNEMGSSFRLEKVTYAMDGVPIKSLVDNDGDLADREEIEILNGPIVPTNHTIAVTMVYRGNGYGIFSYLRGYVFTLRSSFTFHAEEGKVIRITVAGYERGGITTDLKDRPDIRFDSQLSDSRRSPRTAAAGDGR